MKYLFFLELSIQETAHLNIHVLDSKQRLQLLQNFFVKKS